MRFGARECFLLLLILSLPVTSYLLVFRPQNREIEKTRSEIASKQEILTKLRKETNRSEDLRRANDEIRKNIESIEARLPTNREIDSIIRQVTDLAVESGLAAPLGSPEKPERAARYIDQPVNMIDPGSLIRFNHLPSQPR